MKACIIIKIFDIGKSTLYRWVNDHKNGKLNRKIERCKKITPKIVDYIGDYVCKRRNFDRRLLLRRIGEKFNIKISKSSLYRALGKLKIKKKKMYHKIIFMPEKKRRRQIKILKQKINKLPYNNVISIDETSIDSHIRPNYGWSRKGRKLIIAQREPKIRYTAICAITYAGDIYHNIIKNSANGENFLDFVKFIISKLPSNEKYYLLMDNARIHHYKKLHEYLKDQREFEIVYNIPYSPECNPIEKVFNEVKLWLKKRHLNKKNIVKNIKSAFKNISVTNIAKYYDKSFE